MQCARPGCPGVLSLGDSFSMTLLPGLYHHWISIARIFLRFDSLPVANASAIVR